MMAYRSYRYSAYQRRLGYERARVLIKQHTGLSLYQLRHRQPPISAGRAPAPL